ncbi:MAG: serine hydroxymethyltransferase [Halobacteriovoraceae bacterium]|nr:serine hydroxymethyltransferase [Halobacteriovoraceae bacterium]MCB9094179.1 serine hydroxymethyltransferase [Halobacteriovoraceae bacterium]
MEIEKVDSEIYNLIKKEEVRQTNGIELIASENYCSRAVMEAQGSVLTNKYAEGYPGKRYYDGCEFVDGVETLAIERVKKLFQCEYANVQPHSGSQANMAAYLTLLEPGAKILGMDLSQGGHLTHGSPVNFSGKLFDVAHYGVDEKSEIIDFNHVEDMAKKHKPQLIIAGASAYPRTLDFKKFKEIADSVGALLLVDMAHIAGLVATGNHPTPIGHADVVTSTTHKTLRGPRGGLILSSEKWEKKLNSAVFPGMQGGPLEHVIAAKAVSFLEALSPEFKTYQDQVVKNACKLSDALLEKGIDIVSKGTDNHLILMKTDSVNLSGKEASTLLEHVGITCNKNMVPGDKRSPFVTSGVRIGTPAITTRGMKENEMEIISQCIFDVLKNPENEAVHNDVKNTIKKLCEDFPIYK